MPRMMSRISDWVSDATFTLQQSGGVGEEAEEGRRGRGGGRVRRGGGEEGRREEKSVKVEVVV